MTPRRNAPYPWLRKAKDRDPHAEDVLHEVNNLHRSLGALLRSPSEGGPRRIGLANLKDEIEPTVYRDVVEIFSSLASYLIDEMEKDGHIFPVPEEPKRPHLTVIPGGGP